MGLPTLLRKKQPCLENTDKKKQMLKPEIKSSDEPDKIEQITTKVLLKTSICILCLTINHLLSTSPLLVNLHQTIHNCVQEFDKGLKR